MSNMEGVLRNRRSSILDEEGELQTRLVGQRRQFNYLLRHWRVEGGGKKKKKKKKKKKDKRLRWKPIKVVHITSQRQVIHENPLFTKRGKGQIYERVVWFRNQTFADKFADKVDHVEKLVVRVDAHYQSKEGETIDYQTLHYGIRVKNIWPSL
jgi:hypothetical protein